VIGAIIEPNHAGESQEDIDNMKAGYFNLPLITPDSLEKLKEDNSRILVYRALNATDVETLKSGTGIIAKNPIGDWGIEDHVLFGSDPDAWDHDPWISTTVDPFIAFNNFNGKQNGVIVVDLAKINSSKLSFPTLELESGTTAHQLAVNDREVLVKYSLPQEAIVGVMFRP
jgi:hypothetical protein